MENILLVLNIVFAILLVILVLIQKSEGGALGIGVSQESFMFSRSAGDFFTKATAVVATLFLGGTKGFDPIPGQIWFALKMFVVIFVLLWFRATWPRLRVDQIMGFAWKGLFGLGIFNIFIVAIEIMIFKTEDGTIGTSNMLIMSGINWIIAI